MLKPCAHAAYCAYQARRRRPFRLSPPACRACVHTYMYRYQSVSAPTTMNTNNKPTNQPHRVTTPLCFWTSWSTFPSTYIVPVCLLLHAPCRASPVSDKAYEYIHVLARVRYVRSTYMRESFLHVVQVERGCLTSSALGGLQSCCSFGMYAVFTASRRGDRPTTNILSWFDFSAVFFFVLFFGNSLALQGDQRRWFSAYSCTYGDVE